MRGVRGDSSIAVQASIESSVKFRWLQVKLPPQQQLVVQLSELWNLGLDVVGAIWNV